MQRVITVAWSLDDKYIISGSDEMNLRVWKSNASEKLGVVCNFCENTIWIVKIKEIISVVK